MRVGLSTASFFGKALTEDSLQIIADMGVRDVEIFLTTFYEYEQDFGKILLEKKGNLNIHSVHTLTNQFEPQLSNRVERTRSDALNIFKKVAYVMQTLGAKYYTFHGTSVIKKSQRHVDYAWHGKCVNVLSDILSSIDAQLTYENVHWALYSKPGFFTNLREYSKDVGAVLDIKQAMQSGYDYRLYLNEMKDVLKTVHVCDYTADGLCPPGMGSFDFVGLVKNLNDFGYDGPLMIELYANDYNGFDDVKKSVDYLNEIIYKTL